MTTSEKQLREIFSSMDAKQAQEIRDSYFKSLEGLQTLAHALEIADAKRPGPMSDPLMNEHLLAVEALETMNKSELGGVL
ncbi:MAG: hypothetical protein WD049_07300 [Candidatus Paceibacterota bacterium]